METAAEIIWMDTVDSTSDELRRRIPHAENLTVVAAVEQTAGRGQRGNKWLTRPGENITLSVLVRPGNDGIPPLKASDAFRLTACTALSVAEYISSKGVRCSVKWPNDIYCGDRKISGMLIESSLSEGYITNSIIGIGINLNQTAFPPEVFNPTSLKRITGSDYDIRIESEILVGILLKNLLSLDSPSLMPDFNSSLYRKDGFYSFTDCSDGTTFEAKIDKVDTSGKLHLTLKNGRSKSFSFKEVSFII